MGKTSRQLFPSFILILIVLFLTSCGGSGGSGNSSGDTRNLTGTISSADHLPSSSGSSEMMAFSDPAVSLSDITVIATATDGTTVTAQTDATGNFTLPLAIGQSYVVSFAEGNVFIGTLIVSLDQAGNFSSRGFRVTAGDGDIALGRVVCSAGVCTAEINPNCEFDDDDDGKPNCEDSDFEDRHPDFNHDGICDDEEGDEDHPIDSNTCEIVAADPFNGELGVELNEKIELRFSSSVNFATVDAASFSLTDSSNTVVAATIRTDDESESGREIELIPASPLAPLSTYTLHVLRTIQCLNGFSPAADTEIQFTTGTRSE